MLKQYEVLKDFDNYIYVHPCLIILGITPGGLSLYTDIDFSNFEKVFPLMTL